MVTRAAALSALGLFSLAECVWGQSNCKDVKADFSLTVPPGQPPKVAVGTVTNGGDLNGTITLTDSVSVGSPTPDPFVVSYTQDVIITTNEGQLTATSLQAFDFFHLIFSVPPFGLNSRIQRIGPTSAKTGSATSTGRFAGATGYYFLTAVATPANGGAFTGPGEITGRICYSGHGANQH
jgi:hypothetical protein